jgi:hypothetical protein
MRFGFKKGPFFVVSKRVDFSGSGLLLLVLFVILVVLAVVYWPVTVTVVGLLLISYVIKCIRRARVRNYKDKD